MVRKLVLIVFLASICSAQGKPSYSGGSNPSVIPVATPTFTPGSGVTSAGCATGYSCNNRRGTLTVVGCTATTGTIVTVSFLLGSPSACFAFMNGGATAFGIGNSAPVTSLGTTSFNITAAVSVISATFNVNYLCQP